MVHLATTTNDRIKDLHETAAELRRGRMARSAHQTTPARGLRLRIGAALIAVGTALVNGGHRVTPSLIGR